MELTLILGALVGAVMGLTGAGGGILAVPTLVAGLGWSLQQAAPVALIAVAGSAALGALQGLRQGLVRYKAAGLMVLAGLPLTSVGIRVAQGLPQQFLSLLFALAMLLVAARFWNSARASGPAGFESHRALAHVDASSGRFHWSWATGWLFVAIGALTGFVTGLLGVGGGFIVVPMLRRFTDLTMHGIVATSLMVIALVSGGGVLSALAHGAQVPMPATALFALTTALGMFAGRAVAAHIAEKQVQLGFALIVTVVALGLMLKALKLG